MTRFKRISIPKTESPQDTKIIVGWYHPSGPYEGEYVEYSINQVNLDKYDTPEELKAAVDQFTSYNFGYTLDDIWFYKYANGTKWAVATGQEPDPWPYE